MRLAPSMYERPTTRSHRPRPTFYAREPHHDYMDYYPLPPPTAGTGIALELHVRDEQIRYLEAENARLEAKLELAERNAESALVAMRIIINNEGHMPVKKATHRIQHEDLEQCRGAERFNAKMRDGNRSRGLYFPSEYEALRVSESGATKMRNKVIHEQKASTPENKEVDLLLDSNTEAHSWGWEWPDEHSGDLDKKKNGPDSGAMSRCRVAPIETEWMKYSPKTKVSSPRVQSTTPAFDDFVAEECHHPGYNYLFSSGPRTPRQSSKQPDAEYYEDAACYQETTEESMKQGATPNFLSSNPKINVTELRKLNQPAPRDGTALPFDETVISPQIPCPTHLNQPYPAPYRKSMPPDFKQVVATVDGLTVAAPSSSTETKGTFSDRPKTEGDSGNSDISRASNVTAPCEDNQPGRSCSSWPLIAANQFYSSMSMYNIHGICYFPGPHEKNTMRTVSIGNLSPQTNVSEIVTRAQPHGAILSIKLVPLMGMKIKSEHGHRKLNTMTALLTYSLEASAEQFVFESSSIPIFIHGRTAHVALLHTPTYPSGLEACSPGRPYAHTITRVIKFHEPGLVLDDEFEGLLAHRTIAFRQPGWIVNKTKKIEHGRSMVYIEFASVELASWAIDRMLRIQAFFGCNPRPVYDYKSAINENGCVSNMLNLRVHEDSDEGYGNWSGSPGDIISNQADTVKKC